MCESIFLDWTLGVTEDIAVTPTEWMPATVPGAVQLDIANHLQLPPLYETDTVCRLTPYEDLWAIYRAALPDGLPQENLILEGKGVDYAFRIRLNDTVLYTQEGMFTPFAVPLTDGWKETGNRLYVDILPPPKAAGRADRSQARESCKPPVCYGWDFHPRLVVRGIWNELTLVRRTQPYLKQVRAHASLDKTLTQGRLTITLTAGDVPMDGCRWSWELLTPEGQVCAGESGDFCGETVTREYTVAHPALWWPNEHGAQALYTLRVTLNRGETRLDSHCLRRGFRHIRLVGAPGYCPEAVQEPQTREPPPITVEVNGQPLFAKGTNWVCPTLFPGTLDEALYRRQLTLIRDAHMNMVRCWGGAVVNKEAFFALCDELGLLVWQEFPLACNDYSDSPAYLQVLEQESRSIIRLVRDHACLALWCGGNELYSAWSGMDDQAPALRLLNKNCYLDDPETPFLPTSPIMGVAHGSYVFRNQHGEDIYQIMNRMHYRAYPEFGCPGAADPALVRRMIPDAEWAQIRPGGCWELHHAVGAWGESAWMMLPVIRHYFPDAVTTEQQLERSRFLQGVGYQALFEETRRQAPYCTMALNWCFNEPWPTAVNNSLLSDGQPKPAYAYVCRALRANMVSVRFARFDHTPGIPIKAEVYLLMDQPQPVSGTIRLTVEQNGVPSKTVCLPAQVAAPGLSTRIGEVTLSGADLQSGLFSVDAVFLPEEGVPASIGDSRYDLLMR